MVCTDFAAGRDRHRFDVFSSSLFPSLLIFVLHATC